MTAAQNRVFLAIKKFIERNGYSPSYRDLQDALDLKSPASVWKHVEALKAQGYIEHSYNKGRSLAICPDKVLQGFCACRFQHEMIYFRGATCPMCALLSQFGVQVSTSPSPSSSHFGASKNRQVQRT